mgnify:CR=1 FL=1
MKILPEFREVKKIAESGQYNVVPISCEILSDFTTPIETMKILKNVSTHCYMLESAVADEQWGRYTFLGFAPKLEITCIDGEMRIGNVKIQSISDRFLQITKVLDLRICLLLQED